MHPVLREAQAKGADFASIRHEKRKGLSISANEDTVEMDESLSRSAYLLRVLIDGGFIYRSTTREPKASDLSATLGLKAVNGGPESLPRLPQLRGSHVINPGANFSKSPEEKLGDIRELRDFVLRSNPLIRSIDVDYGELLVQKEYMDTNGREITELKPYSRVLVEAVGGSGNNAATAYASAATAHGYVLDFTTIEALGSTVNRRLGARLKGVSAKRGEYKVVMSPATIGTFVHEAVGHPAEADWAVGGLLQKLRGKKIASGAVNIVDAPALDMPLSNCDMKYDDEGVQAKPVRIVDGGVVKGIMTDLSSSGKLGLPRSGNARAEDATVPTRIRMRNTYMEPGDTGVDELIRSVRDGYLIAWAPNGETDASDGTFQFGIEEGYIIRRGEVVASLKGGMSISGFTIETLAGIDGVAKDFGIDTGTCGKYGQSVPVTCGGPHVRIRSLKVG